MSRNRQSAKKAGSSFERLVADYLRDALGDDRIDRRPRHGAKDRGDIGGAQHMGERLVFECKNTTRIELSRWLAEAETERGNDDALAGIVVHKRRGKTAPQEQYVTMRLGDLAALLTGDRDHA